MRGLARVRAFFNAPVVIFHLNILSYFSFLCLFAYVLMVDFQPSPSWCERLIYLWLFSLVCEELRQVRPPFPRCPWEGGVSPCPLVPSHPPRPLSHVALGPRCSHCQDLSNGRRCGQRGAAALSASLPSALLSSQPPVARPSQEGPGSQGLPQPEGTPFSPSQSGGP